MITAAIVGPGISVSVLRDKLLRSPDIEPRWMVTNR